MAPTYDILYAYYCLPSNPREHWHSNNLAFAKQNPVKFYRELSTEICEFCFRVGVGISIPTPASYKTIERQAIDYRLVTHSQPSPLPDNLL
jgi:hypothetical protein